MIASPRTGSLCTAEVGWSKLQEATASVVLPVPHKPLREKVWLSSTPVHKILRVEVLRVRSLDN